MTRLRSALAGSITLLAIAGVAPAHAAAAVPPSQPLVSVLGNHIARTAPSVHASRIATVASRRPLTGVRTILPVRGRAKSSDGRAWVRVSLPGRPNGRSGWIPAAGTRATSTEWRISVRLGERRVVVFWRGKVVRRFTAIVGATSTPTPRGRFFIEEPVALNASAAGGPYALASSARSNVLQEFDGGPGQIALHGMGNLSGTLGTAASHGCVRLGAADITWLARRIPAGVPLTIVG